MGVTGTPVTVTGVGAAYTYPAGADVAIVWCGGPGIGAEYDTDRRV